MNLPPLLAAHLGRTETGVPLQPSHASCVEGNPPPPNMGGSPFPNGMYSQYQPQLLPHGFYPPAGGPPNNPSLPQAYKNMPFSHPMAFPPYTMSNGHPFNMITPYPPYLNQTPSGVPLTIIHTLASLWVQHLTIVYIQSLRVPQHPS